MEGESSEIRQELTNMAQTTQIKVIVLQYKGALRLAGVSPITAEQEGVLEKSLANSIELLEPDKSRINPELSRNFGEGYKGEDVKYKQNITRIRNVMANADLPGHTNADALKLYEMIKFGGQTARHAGKKTMVFLENYLREKRIIE